MMKHMNNALRISEIEEKISKVENVLSCCLVGFNTKKPSVRVFFEKELEQGYKYKILDDVKAIMIECGLGDNKETRWCTVGFEILYTR